jgi:hypothetical protein
LFRDLDESVTVVQTNFKLVFAPLPFEHTLVGDTRCVFIATRTASFNITNGEIVEKETLTGSKQVLMCYSAYVDHWALQPPPFRLTASGAAKRWAHDMANPKVFKDSES